MILHVHGTMQLGAPVFAVRDFASLFSTVRDFACVIPALNFNDVFYCSVLTSFFFIYYFMVVTTPAR